MKKLLALLLCLLMAMSMSVVAFAETAEEAPAEEAAAEAPAEETAEEPAAGESAHPDDLRRPERRCADVQRHRFPFRR